MVDQGSLSTLHNAKSGGAAEPKWALMVLFHRSRGNETRDENLKKKMRNIIICILPSKIDIASSRVILISILSSRWSRTCYIGWLYSARVEEFAEISHLPTF